MLLNNATLSCGRLHPATVAEQFKKNMRQLRQYGGDRYFRVTNFTKGANITIVRADQSSAVSFSL